MKCRGDTLLLLGLLLSSLWVKASTAVDMTIIVLTVAQNDLATANPPNAANFTGDESSGYFPLSNALESVMRLAADDINAWAWESLGLTEGTLKMAVAGVNSGAQAMEGFCNSLEAVGENGTFGVSIAQFEEVVNRRSLRNTFRRIVQVIGFIVLHV